MRRESACRPAAEPVRRMGFLKRTRAVAHALLSRVGRPLRRGRAGDLVIEGYRGFGTRREFHLLLRVTRSTGGRWDGHTGDLRASLKRLFRRGVGGQVVTARFGNDWARRVTDDNGYDRMRLTLTEPADAEPLWHRVTLGLDAGNGTGATVDCDVLVPPQAADLLVVSDIDDTVMLTGVASKLRMFWRLFARGARSRLAFPGAAALYRAFHGPQRNPIIYVSRSPWSIYAMLDAFFRRHEIPVGPVMFLRDWGVSWRSPLPRRATEHKADVIREILDLYQDLPVVLIGDSGQCLVVSRAGTVGRAAA